MEILAERTELAMFCLVEDEFVPMVWLVEEMEGWPMDWLVEDEMLVPVFWLVAMEMTEIVPMVMARSFWRK